MKILVTGSAGFISGYTVAELLDAGHEVVGIDNYSKYGEVERSYDDHPNYRLVRGDCKDVELMKELAIDCDQILASAAMIGGISYFHALAYDLLVENERIIGSTFDAALHAQKHGKLKKINVLSSSMVFESTDVYPTPEGNERECPPPESTYGFQKLSCEYHAQGAWQQYELPYTIIRPFNCVGIGEQKALKEIEIKSGNLNLALSHVVPDLVAKIAKGQDPLRLFGDGNQVRHYTYGGDLARGIRTCIESEKAINDDFNLSTPTPHTVLELAEAIWKKMRPDQPFRVEHDEPFQHDVQKRTPSVEKAKRVLGYEATTTLDEILDEVIPWIEKRVELDQA
ncbi:MAG: NAD-dependent epimerase/dehydratase family protein [Acidobacteriota bacterium]